MLGLFSASSLIPGPWPATFGQETPGAAVDESDQEVQAEAIESIEKGDFEHARALLDDLLLQDYLRRAAEQTAQGDPALALNLIDRALALAPKHLASQLAKAETSLLLAQQGIRVGAPASLITGSMRDAFEHFVKASKQDPGAAFGATRAAHMLGSTQDALRWARIGRELLHQDPAGAQAFNDLDPSPQRILAEAFFRGYTEASSALSTAQAALDPKDSEARLDPALAAAKQALFVEAEDALGSLLGRDSHRPWVWSTLADLYTWEGRMDLSLQRLEQGLARLPGDSTLLPRLSNVAHQAVGREASLKLVEELCAQSPDDTLSHYYLGLERFELGLEYFASADYRAPLFAQVEADFRRSRELFAGNTELCIAYELVARCARGWCAYYGDQDLELATREFLSMNDLKPGGISYDWPGKLRSGIFGLAFIGDSYNQRGDNLNAARAFEAAHHADKGDGNWANNAGFFLRDAAVEIEYLGKELCRAAEGSLTDPESLKALRLALDIDPEAPPSDEPALFHAAALERLAQARDLIWRSWLAYEKAAEIQSDDVRIVNDAGLVLVYYDHRKLDVAEALLLHAAELGAVQVPAMRAAIDAADLDEADREAREIEFRDLKEAWGDAYQNLGVLEWVHRGNAPKALAYLERSVAIGPDPRPDLSNNLMPIVRGEIQPQAGNYFDLQSWGRPCSQD